MLELLQRMFGKSRLSSKEVAKERLRLVLVHDRANVSPQLMEILKEDMIRVISNYMEINEQEMEVNFTKTNSSIALVANIPVNHMKRNRFNQD